MIHINSHDFVERVKHPILSGWSSKVTEAAASPNLITLARLKTLPRHGSLESTKARGLQIPFDSMDAAEYEGDVQLQKAASGLLADFETSLQPFLWRTLDSGKLRIRRRVRVREKDRMLRLVGCTLFADLAC